MAIIANGINIINPIISVGGVQQNIDKIYASHNGVDTLVWTKRNFLNIEYAQNTIQKAWLDIESDGKGTQLAVFSTSCSYNDGDTTDSWKRTYIYFGIRRLINSNQTNAEIQSILAGALLRDVTAITRLEAAPNPILSSEWYVYKEDGNAIFREAMGTKLTTIIQDCAPDFEFVNNKVEADVKTNWVGWQYRASYEIFGSGGSTSWQSGDGDIPGPVLHGSKIPGSIIYAAKAPASGTIRVALDSTDRYSIRVYGQNNVKGSSPIDQEGPNYTTITKL